jgi:MtN3 and saliva related transmembrane protein
MSTEVIGIIAGVFTSVSLLPQLVKIIKEKKAKDLSYGMLIVLLIGLGCWIWYGVLREDWPIIVTNGISFIINSLMIVFTIKYKEKGHK